MVNQWLNKTAVAQCDAQESDGDSDDSRCSDAQSGRAQRFRSPRVQVDDVALAILLHHKLIRSWLTDPYRKLRRDRRANVSAPDELKGIERRLKTMDVRRRHAKDDAQRNRILKSKTERWDDANRQHSLGRRTANSWHDDVRLE